MIAEATDGIEKKDRPTVQEGLVRATTNYAICESLEVRQGAACTRFETM